MSVFLLLHLHSSVHVLVQKAQVLDCVRSAILSSQLCQLLVCNMMLFALPRYLFVKVIGHIIWAQKGIGLRVILSNMKLWQSVKKLLTRGLRRLERPPMAWRPILKEGGNLNPRTGGARHGWGSGHWSTHLHDFCFHAFHLSWCYHPTTWKWGAGEDGSICVSWFSPNSMRMCL